MQTSAAFAANPFAMLLDLDKVVREVAHSERLNRLHSRVYRPLDKPMLSKGEASADFDRQIDEAIDEPAQDLGLDGDFQAGLSQ